MGESYMARRISIRRLILALVAVVLGMTAAFFYSEYRDLDRRFHEWLIARPMSMAVDLSRPGTFTAPFQQTCDASHGEAIYLAVESPDAVEPGKLLEGLDARIAIVDTDGKEVYCEKAGPEFRQEGDDIQLAYFHPFSTGSYTARIEVSAGAPALQGIEQTLFAKYRLCGLERLPADIARALALLSGIPAALMALFSAVQFYRHGIWVRHPGDGIGPPRCGGGDPLGKTPLGG